MSAYAELGRECAGFIGSAPDVRLNWSGVSEELFISFESTSDTTLVVRASDGWYYCSDDFYGLDPLVAIEYPLAGSYQIWVGSFSSGQYHPGVLTISELY